MNRKRIAVVVLCILGAAMFSVAGYHIFMPKILTEEGPFTIRSLLSSGIARKLNVSPDEPFIFKVTLTNIDFGAEGLSTGNSEDFIYHYNSGGYLILTNHAASVSVIIKKLDLENRWWYRLRHMDREGVEQRIIVTRN
jgi:hypothetical protein